MSHTRPDDGPDGPPTRADGPDHRHEPRPPVAADPPPALDHLALLVDVQDRFAEAAAQVDPDTPVPWCGRWRVHHLVVHLARIHHWAAAQARGRAEVPLGRGPFVPVHLYHDCALELRQTLTELGPDHEGSTLLGRGPASFWRRRQLHETSVHLWDLRVAGGLEPYGEPQVWSDTVDEVVTVMAPRQVQMGRMPALAAGVALTAQDTGRRWLLGDADPAVAVGGAARDLALLLWRRRPPERLDLRVDGDRAVLHRLLAHRLTP